MSERCQDWDCEMMGRGGCYRTTDNCTKQAQNPALTTAGLVGSSGLLVAREGDQQLGTTGSQLAPLVARPTLNHKSGFVCCECEQHCESIYEAIEHHRTTGH